MKKNNIIILTLILIGIELGCTQKSSSIKELSIQNSYSVELLLVRDTHLTEAQEKDNSDSVKLVFFDNFANDTCLVKLIDRNLTTYKTLTIASLKDTIVKVDNKKLVFIEYYLQNKKIFVYDHFFSREYGFIHAKLSTDLLKNKHLTMKLSNTMSVKSYYKE